MTVHYPGTPLDQRSSGFPASVCRAEQLWTTAHKAGKRAVVFDWAQSTPYAFEEGLIHVGEDGRPDNAIRALQEVRAYTTHPRQPGPHVTEIHPDPVEGALVFEVPILPGKQSRYRRVESLYARALRGPEGYDRLALLSAADAPEPLLTVRLGRWSPWVEHTFITDRGPARAGLRAKLLRLSPEGDTIHLYLSEIYTLDDFCHPASLAPELVRQCGPFIIQCSRQQVVQGGASDIETYFEEQRYLARWWRDAAGHLLDREPWDLFMLKWHGPDWTNHLTMYMVDPRHPMYEPERAEEGWALWDQIMGWGDEIVARVVEAAGPDALIALVSDHGGDTALPYPGAGQRTPNDVLAENGWLVVDKSGAVDWQRSVAYGVQHYVTLNVAGREPGGLVEPGAPYERLRDEIVEALLAAVDERGRHRYRVVLPMETAGRLGVGGDRVGDIFLLPAPAAGPTDVIDREAFWRTHTREETGTWDWPRLNAGTHRDDSYFVLCGPGVKAGYRRPRPTLITSVAPTLATAWGIPVPADADGSVLRDFLE
jgi:hypothetical protein